MLLIYWLWQSINSVEHIFATANEIKSGNVKIKNNKSKTYNKNEKQVFVRMRMGYCKQKLRLGT